MKPKKILFTGGGTGGHVTPNLAISQSLQKTYPDAFFYYVGKKGKAEESMVPKGWKDLFSSSRASLHFVETTSGSIKSPKVLFLLFIGFLQACLLLLRHRPNIIIASGGYVSAPILFAAGFLRKIKLSSAKIMLHEANAEVGKMIRMASGFADIIAYSFPGTQLDQKKKRFVGYPVRSNIVQKNNQEKDIIKAKAREKLGIPENAKFVLAFGGSQGARTINRGMVDALPILLSDPDVYIMHGTGKKLSGAAYDGLKDVEARLKTILSEEKEATLPADHTKRYIYKDFMDNIGDYYAAADLVVCRGGAGSLVEVCANGMAAVCIPKADLAGDHQAVNARVLERLGAIKVIFESKNPLDPDSVESIQTEEFALLVLSLLNDPQKRQDMGAIAAQQYDPETAKKCTQLVQFMLNDIEAEPVLRAEPEMPEETILGKGLLSIISILNKARNTNSLTPEQRRMILYKIDIAASQKSLVSPARACRMIGIGRFHERLEILLNFALNHSKSPFTRRDAFVGLRHLEILNEDVLHTIIKGLKDPYFETVNEALYALFTLLKKTIIIEKFFLDTPKDILVEEQKLIESMRSTLEKNVIPLSQSKEFDIRMNALGVLSLLSTDISSMKGYLEQNYFHPNWQVRKKVVECFHILQQRNQITTAEIQKILREEFLQTSNGFNMDFLLKSEIKKIFQHQSQNQFTTELKQIILSSDSKEEKMQTLQSMTFPNISLTPSEIKQELLSYSPEEFFHHTLKQLETSVMTTEEKDEAMKRIYSLARQYHVPISSLS